MNASDQLPVTSELAFCCLDSKVATAAPSAGIYPDRDAILLYDTLQEAQADCKDMLVVIDRFEAEEDVGDEDDSRTGTERHVPGSLLLNLGPYRDVVEVTAAGGLIVRRLSDSLQALLIYRRGVWDLPKGKLDRGESVEACAIREVREELGIEDVDLLRPLGETVHGYVDGDAYAVKTTHWFQMSTTATTFTPQTEEQIEAVQWYAWEEAIDRVGYETLRRHLHNVAHLLQV